MKVDREAMNEFRHALLSLHPSAFIPVLLVVGGSIVIPHLRRVFAYLEQAPAES